MLTVMEPGHFVIGASGILGGKVVAYVSYAHGADACAPLPDPSGHVIKGNAAITRRICFEQPAIENASADCPSCCDFCNWQSLPDLPSCRDQERPAASLWRMPAYRCSPERAAAHRSCPAYPRPHTNDIRSTVRNLHHLPERQDQSWSLVAFSPCYSRPFCTLKGAMV
jgi:hypothetical protein